MDPEIKNNSENKYIRYQSLLDDLRKKINSEKFNELKIDLSPFDKKDRHDIILKVIKLYPCYFIITWAQVIEFIHDVSFFLTIAEYSEYNFKKLLAKAEINLDVKYDFPLFIEDPQIINKICYLCPWLAYKIPQNLMDEKKYVEASLKSHNLIKFLPEKIKTITYYNDLCERDPYFFVHLPDKFKDMQKLINAIKKAMDEKNDEKTKELIKKSPHDLLRRTLKELDSHKYKYDKIKSYVVKIILERSENLDRIKSQSVHHTVDHVERI